MRTTFLDLQFLSLSNYPAKENVLDFRVSIFNVISARYSRYFYGSYNMSIYRPAYLFYI